MAARISINESRFKDRKNAYVVRMSRAASDAAIIGSRVVREMAAAEAPTPFDEERIINGAYNVGSIKFVVMDDPKEEGRVRFFKGSNQEYLQTAILDNPLLFSMRATGFSGPNIAILDEITKWSYTNVMRPRNSKGNSTTKTYESTHGSWWAFEYGWQWLVKPNPSHRGGKGENYLSPEPGVYTGPFVKSIPAKGMFTKLDKTAVIDAMKLILGEVKF